MNTAKYVYRSLVLPLVCAVSCASAAAQEATAALKACVSFDTVVTKKEACYLLNVQTGQAHWEITFGSGINITAGSILLGGSASAMLVTTIKLDKNAAKTAAEAVKVAQNKFEVILPEPAQRKPLRGLFEPIANMSIGDSVGVKVNPFKTTFGPASPEVRACVKDEPTLEKYIGLGLPDLP